MGIDWERLSAWLEREIAKPVTHYKQPLRKLAQRAAASVLLDQDLERLVPDLATLEDKVEGLPALADLAAAKLTISNAVDNAAHTCVARYAAEPHGGGGDALRAEHDEAAIGAALLIGNHDVARSAISARAGRQFDDSVAISAELAFLANEVLRGGQGDSLIFAAVRGIDRSILAALNRSVAPFICAFGASTGAELRLQLRGALQRYDELSFAGEHAPYLLKPVRLEVLPKESRITVVVAAARGDGFRLDVINAPALLDDLPSTFSELRKALTDKDRRAFDKLRKEPTTELEIAITEAPKVKAGDVFARRVAAALTLMRPANYAIEKVAVTIRTGTTA
jgi:hypothetical protein